MVGQFLIWCSCSVLQPLTLRAATSLLHLLQKQRFGQPPTQTPASSSSSTQEAFISSLSDMESVYRFADCGRSYDFGNDVNWDNQTTTSPPTDNNITRSPISDSKHSPSSSISNSFGGVNGSLLNPAANTVLSSDDFSPENWDPSLTTTQTRLAAYVYSFDIYIPLNHLITIR
jgi:hypothetical protein